MSDRTARHRGSASHLGDVTIAGNEAYHAAERAAREHYSRVLASLAAQFRDVAAAEDALADSLVAALAQWPLSGVPANPAAWLLTVARRRLSDGLRRQSVANAARDHLACETAMTMVGPPTNDRRLELLFACAHPAIAEEVRAPLMLQVVFGLEASAIAGLFLMSPAAMAQRLVRAKQKIRDASIPFSIPDTGDYPLRLGCVLTAIYALFTCDGIHWRAPSGNRDGLADEAIWLAHLVADLSGRDPEALGLLALMLFVEARRSARRDARGRYVPLSEQDVGRWDGAMTAKAEALLHEAATKSATGRFQLEAAVQSAHAARAKTGATDWPAILALYDGIASRGGGVVARINRAVAILHVRGADAALAALAAIETDPRAIAYQPYWAARAHILAQAHRCDEAMACYDRAIALEKDESVIAFLKERQRALA